MGVHPWGIVLKNSNSNHNDSGPLQPFALLLVVLETNYRHRSVISDSLYQKVNIFFTVKSLRLLLFLVWMSSY